MLQSKKHVFWEALVITVVIFIFGFLLGVSYESRNLIKVNDFYITSEIDLADELAVIQLMDTDKFDCATLEKTSIDLANKVYEDAIIIQEYESTGIVTDSLELMHKKFDILRSFIWINNFRIFEACDPQYNLIVYLYEQHSENLIQNANQNVMSKILFEIKQEQGNSVLLIPIAADQNITSLDLIISQYDIPQYPALIINNEKVLTNVETKAQVEAALNEYNQNIQ